MPDSSPSRVICVLGMHRSGTSAITGTLEEAGVYLGPVSKQNEFNRKGNREHPEIMRLQEQILVDNGGSWDAPPAKVTWKAEHRAGRDAVIASFAGKATWGFKDPRTVLTFDGWAEALPRMVLLGMFRHPIAVARSLTHRNSIPLEKGLELWASYNVRLLEIHGRKPFPLISFDEPADALDRSMRTAFAALGLPVAAGRLGFFDEELRHQKPDSEPLPPKIHSLYDELRARAMIGT